MPVPATCCVGEEAFETALEAAGIATRVRDLRSALPDEDARAELEELVASTPLPGEVGGPLAAAARDVAQDGLLAVRSSAADEDSAGGSFAGRHETVVGVAPDSAEQALRRCWASRWSQPAIAYRVRRGLALDRISMPVAIQRLVPAERSAVVFTAHPVTGSDDVVVNATWGLGEPLVSGRVTPDTFVVERGTGRVLESEEGAKEVGVFVNTTGLAERTPERRGPALDDQLLRALVETCLNIERAFGTPVDVEAAYGGGMWHFVQARPVTTGAVRRSPAPALEARG